MRILEAQVISTSIFLREATCNVTVYDKVLQVSFYSSLYISSRFTKLRYKNGMTFIRHRFAITG